ncbi:MAG: response regulator [Candidatus Abyssobacteria bacterium SURF_17]|uniref:Response regulator n=1 Tax=Candidatus Abyssobacteria bacterium SURF_17 TaxID=2093361 RepID=A0A419EUI0_9BACT|nr:MAG: response regulator [Candidatus Abyssubacteria bacterium SURF_17]
MANAKKKILVLDDEPDVVTYLVSLLEDNDYIVVSAMDGKAGMEKAKSEKPDLITLDISMPEKSGIRFYREIKADPELKKIPIVIVTGVSSTQDAGTGKDFERFLGTRKQVPPPEGFIMKPIEEAELLGTVKKLLNA